MQENVNGSLPPSSVFSCFLQGLRYYETDLSQFLHNLQRTVCIKILSAHPSVTEYHTDVVNVRLGLCPLKQRIYLSKGSFIKALVMEINFDSCTMLRFLITSVFSTIYDDFLT